MKIISKNFGKNYVTKSGISKSQVRGDNEPKLLKDFQAEFKKEQEEKGGIILQPLLYGKGQAGKGAGLIQEAPTGKKKNEQPFKMGTTTAKASWKR